MVLANQVFITAELGLSVAFDFNAVVEANEQQQKTVIGEVVENCVQGQSATFISWERPSLFTSTTNVAKDPSGVMFLFAQKIFEHAANIEKKGEAKVAIGMLALHISETGEVTDLLSEDGGSKNKLHLIKSPGDFCLSWNKAVGMQLDSSKGSFVVTIRMMLTDKSKNSRCVTADVSLMFLGEFHFTAALDSLSCNGNTGDSNDFDTFCESEYDDANHTPTGGQSADGFDMSVLTECLYDDRGSNVNVVKETIFNVKIIRDMVVPPRSVFLCCFMDPAVDFHSALTELNQMRCLATVVESSYVESATAVAEPIEDEGLYRENCDLRRELVQAQTLMKTVLEDVDELETQVENAEETAMRDRKKYEEEVKRLNNERRAMREELAVNSKEWGEAQRKIQRCQNTMMKQVDKVKALEKDKELFKQLLLKGNEDKLRRENSDLRRQLAQMETCMRHEADKAPQEDWMQKVTNSRVSAAVVVVEASGVESVTAAAGPTDDQVSDKSRAAFYMLKKAKRVKEDPPAVYKIPVEFHEKTAIVVPRDNSFMCEAEKVIMVVGPCGAGKTTLVNAMANYFIGVAWDDPFRFELISQDEESGHNQSRGQTQDVKAYTFFPRSDSPVPYKVTIVDTPGFGDPDGIERDQQIVTQIKDFFSTGGQLDHINAIGYVSPAALARLTPTQRYIFDSVLSLFGNDVKENIFLLATFADSNKPPVEIALQEYNMPNNGTFKFNNSALFSDNVDQSYEAKISKLFWEMGEHSMKAFFNGLLRTEPKSLSLTREVLREREHLETALNGINPKITVSLNKQEELRQIQQQIDKHEADIETNKNFKVSVDVTKMKKIDLDRGKYVTNCIVCNMTCHFPCYIPNDDGKHGCAAMGNGRCGPDATCAVCPGNCHWQKHCNNTYRFELYKDTEMQHINELYEKYGVAKNEKDKAEALRKGVQTELDEVAEICQELIEEAQKSNRRLDEIALRPNPMSMDEYIEQMIQAEKQGALPGFSERVKYLRSAQQKAKLNASIQSVKPRDKGLMQKIVSFWK